MRFKLSALAVLGLFAQTAFAFEPFTVRQIRIEGAERIEAGTIYTYLPLKSGDHLDSTGAQQAMNSLFATGFFNDVRLEIDGEDLVVVVQERPIISVLRLSGFKDFNESELRSSLKAAGLAEARVFDQALLDGAVQELERQYFGRGKYSVQINARVTPLDKNRVEVSLDVSEGLASKIRELTITGNQAFSTKKLLDRLSLSTGSWWNPFDSSDVYSKVRLQGDEETLRSYYQNRGFIEFDMGPTQVSISPDKKDIFIAYSIKEGAAYTVGDISFAGEKLVPEDELRQLVGVKAGEVFSRDAISASVMRISERLAEDGYAFATVNPVPELDQKKHIVSFVFVIDPGRRIYVNRINITGNTVTRDRVIRREMRQLESSVFAGKSIKTSKRRLDMLGFFSDVRVDTPRVPGTSDQVDVNVKVTEKETGNMLFGLGYSQSQGAVANASIAQSNFLGTGNRLELRLNGSQLNRTYSLSLNEPYWTMEGVSRGYDIYQRYVDPTSVDLGQYSTETIGTRVRFGVPISESNSVFFGLGLEKQKTQLYDNTPQKYVNFVNEYGSENLTVLGTVGWASDERDSGFKPTRGSYQRLSIEGALPGGDIQYVKASWQYQWFYPVTRHLTFMANTELGWGAGYGGQKLPFYQNFYAGGVDTVRGYRSSSLGGRDENGDPLGGDRRAIGNLELFFPITASEEESSLRTSVFLDGGWVYSPGEPFDLGKLKYSTGLALSWISPMGPLKFSLGFPINDEEGDRIQRPQFQIGNIF